MATVVKPLHVPPLALPLRVPATRPACRFASTLACAVSEEAALVTPTATNKKSVFLFLGPEVPLSLGSVSPRLGLWPPNPTSMVRLRGIELGPSGTLFLAAVGHAAKKG